MIFISDTYDTLQVVEPGLNTARYLLLQDYSIGDSSNGKKYDCD